MCLDVPSAVRRLSAYSQRWGSTFFRAFRRATLAVPLTVYVKMGMIVGSRRRRQHLYCYAAHHVLDCLVCAHATRSDHVLHRSRGRLPGNSIAAIIMAAMHYKYFRSISRKRKIFFTLDDKFNEKINNLICIVYDEFLITSRSIFILILQNKSNIIMLGDIG